MNVEARFSGQTVEVVREKLCGLSQESCPERYEILIVTSGEGEMTVEGKRFELACGSVFLTRPPAYRIITLKNELELYRVAFTEKSLTAIPAETSSAITKGEPACAAYRAGELLPLMLSTVERFFCASLLPSERRSGFSSALLSELLVLVSSLSGETARPTDGELGARVAEYIDRHLTEDLSLEAISRAFFVSKYYLCRAFRKFSGTSIHSYVTAKRVSLAGQMIEAGEIASSVAYKVGFGDYSAFYRAYTKHKGKAPTGR